MKKFLKKLLGRILPQPPISPWVQTLCSALHEHPSLFKFEPQFSPSATGHPGLEVDAVVLSFKLGTAGQLPKFDWAVEYDVRHLAESRLEVVIKKDSISCRDIYFPEICLSVNEANMLSSASMWWIHTQD